MRITVVNIKCQWCTRTIVKSLEKNGATDITIDIPTGVISLESVKPRIEIVELLGTLGYPEIWSPEAKKLSKKVKSYISCAIGKIS